MRQVFLDTETTGLNAEGGDRIVEIGCLEMVNRRMTERQIHFYLNPERSSHPDAAKVHGLSDAFLADKPPFGAIADQLLEFVQGADVVIHNAAFDVAFLDAELRRLGRPAFSSHVGRVSDSLALAREMFPGKSNSLDALCRRLEVDNTHRKLHGALLDAGLLAEVYIRLTRGQDSFVIDGSGAAGANGLVVDAIDLSQFELLVLHASDDELSAHEAVLAELDRSSGGRTIWRVVMA